MGDRFHSVLEFMVAEWDGVRGVSESAGLESCNPTLRARTNTRQGWGTQGYQRVGGRAATSYNPAHG
jgi:hypothetical protein